MFRDNAAIFDELVAGHADLMITDGVEARLQQKLHPGLCAIHPDAPFTVSPNRLPAATGHPAETIRRFGWLHTAKESGAFDRLLLHLPRA